MRAIRPPLHSDANTTPAISRQTRIDSKFGRELSAELPTSICSGSEREGKARFYNTDLVQVSPIAPRVRRPPPAGIQAQRATRARQAPRRTIRCAGKATRPWSRRGAGRAVTSLRHSGSARWPGPPVPAQRWHAPVPASPLTPYPTGAGAGKCAQASDRPAGCGDPDDRPLRAAAGRGGRGRRGPPATTRPRCRWAGSGAARARAARGGAG